MSAVCQPDRLLLPFLLAPLAWSDLPTDERGSIGNLIICPWEVFKEIFLQPGRKVFAIASWAIAQSFSRFSARLSPTSCPKWPKLWLRKFIFIGSFLKVSHFNYVPMVQTLWSPMYQMHMWIGSGLLQISNLLGARGRLHCIPGESLATVRCLLCAGCWRWLCGGRALTEVLKSIHLFKKMRPAEMTLAACQLQITFFLCRFLLGGSPFLHRWHQYL